MIARLTTIRRITPTKRRPVQLYTLTSTTALIPIRPVRTPTSTLFFTHVHPLTIRTTVPDITIAPRRPISRNRAVPMPTAHLPFSINFTVRLRLTTLLPFGDITIVRTNSDVPTLPDHSLRREMRPTLKRAATKNAYLEPSERSPALLGVKNRNDLMPARRQLHWSKLNSIPMHTRTVREVSNSAARKTQIRSIKPQLNIHVRRIDAKLHLLINGRLKCRPNVMRVTRLLVR
jgi:hypothetical protein